MKPDLDKVKLVAVDFALKGGRFWHARDNNRHTGGANNMVYVGAYQFNTNIVLCAWVEKNKPFDFHHEIDFAEAIRLIEKYWAKNKLMTGEIRQINRYAENDDNG